jgi:hypothetical protein
LSVCVSPLSLLGNGSVNTFPRQRIQVTIEELLDASFSMLSASYQRRVVLPRTSCIILCFLCYVLCSFLTSSVLGRNTFSETLLSDIRVLSFFFSE